MKAFLERLVRIDPAALVRLRPAGPDRLELWARLPWGALVTRTERGSAAEDRTVRAADLLAGAGHPARHDAEWVWPLPGRGAVTVERVPAATIRELGTAAERTVRAALGGPVGERMVRDAVLDHIAIVVSRDQAAPGGAAPDPGPAGPPAEVTKPTSTDIDRIEVPQRLVQAVMRMGFLRRRPSEDEPTVRVLQAGLFVGLAGEYGAAWYRQATDLPIHRILRSGVPT